MSRPFWSAARCALCVAMLVPAASLPTVPVRAQELLYTLEVSALGFGSAVSGVPDANGDGRGDLLVGAFGEFSDEGRARLYSGDTGGLLRTFRSPNPEGFYDTHFGWAVAGVPDADGDGRGDLLVGAPKEDTDGDPNGRDDQGRAYLFSGAMGTLLLTLQSPNSSPVGNFGSAVAGLSDVDGDGRGDLLVGARYENPGTSPAYAGRAYVFSGASGALLFELRSPNEEEGGYFGLSVSGVADANGDGRRDLLVGATGEDGGAVNAGRSYVFSGATGQILHTLESPNPEGPDSFFAAAALASPCRG